MPTIPALRRTTMQETLSTIESWVFDLDNTLYPASCNLHSLMGARIGQYVAKTLKLDPEEAFAVQKQYFLEHGTTLSGMMARHDTDPYDYLEFVHDFPLDTLSDAPPLADKIAALPGRKIIFTNADAPYAKRVLDTLQIEHLFEDIVDIHRISYRPKPDGHAYQTLLRETGVDPASAIFFEDQARNLAPAKALGMATVWIDGNIGFGAPDAQDGHIDYRTDDLAAWLDNAIETLQIQPAK